ncbi:hypothetical protein ACWGI9_22900 [Streptomyces sp. NPDC054833]
MYEMRVGSATSGRDGFEWHVMTKDDACTALCGCHLAEAALTGSGWRDTPTERCCSPCIAAFRAALQATTDELSRRCAAPSGSPR